MALGRRPAGEERDPGDARRPGWPTGERNAAFSRILLTDPATMANEKPAGILGPGSGKRQSPKASTAAPLWERLCGASRPRCRLLRRELEQSLHGALGAGRDLADARVVHVARRRDDSVRVVDDDVGLAGRAVLGAHGLEGASG